ncbi:cell wall anchor protein [Paenibacillus ginsengarvi]|uniref:Cell wall anchor protein n=2 Tax=Paenibacillus ginsengarvi TaxID=400777 RepID=A0A3B0CTB0_9BACL|nr:cell wall anchor protein [Paenibacillus ginsengarvi]
MNNATNTTHAYATDNRNNNNWGWLGLAGLLGLAGMRNRSKDPQK